MTSRLKARTLPVRPFAANMVSCHLPLASKRKGNSLASAVSSENRTLMSAPFLASLYFKVPRSAVIVPISAVALASFVSRANAHDFLPSGSFCRPIWGSIRATRGITTRPKTSGHSLMSNSAALALMKNGSLAQSGFANSSPSILTLVVLPKSTDKRCVISKRRPSCSVT